MRNSSLIQFIRHKYDLITVIHMGSSLLSFLSPLCRQFDLWVRYKGDLISRQDHFNFYKWFSFEFATPIFDIPTQNRAQIPDLGNFSPISSLRVG